MGNHVVAETMYGKDPGVMLYAPLRTLIYEATSGTQGGGWVRLFSSSVSSLSSYRERRRGDSPGWILGRRGTVGDGLPVRARSAWAHRFPACMSSWGSLVIPAASRASFQSSRVGKSPIRVPP